MSEFSTIDWPVIGTTYVSDGYVCAAAVSSANLKFQVLLGEGSYNYDMPNDGTAMAFPLNMGDGHYTFRIMQNTSGNNYVELYADSADVVLNSEFEPYLRPTEFCWFDSQSACVAKARELAAGAQNQGDVVREVCTWVVDNVEYDYDKAEQLAGKTGYIPNPDETLASQSGICFDYSALTAAMLRSLHIPCKIVTGYVTNDVYHAWNMVYIDGSWTSVEFSVSANEWSRVDVTFASTGGGSTVGDGTSYTDRYVY